MSIDIGCEAIARPDGAGYNTTWINEGNPANDTGTINSVEIWAQANLTGCKVGIFYATVANEPHWTKYKCRSAVTLGTVTSGSKQTITTDSESNAISLDVVTGDVIGIYFSGASSVIECTEAGGDGIRVATTDHVVVDDETAYVATSGTLSLYGVASTVAVPTVVTNAATSVGSFSAILNGEITATGGENADERGFDYGLTDSYGTSWTQTGTYGVASFHSSSHVDDLSPYRTYHFRAKAHNSAGWGYGEDLTFTTLIAKPLETYLSPTRLYKTTFEPVHLYDAKLTPERLYTATLEPIHLYEAELKVKPTDTYKATLKAEHQYEASLIARRY